MFVGVALVGLSVGLCVGESVGGKVGDSVGDSVGSQREDGADVGADVGQPNAHSVPAGVGTFLDLNVGSEVGLRLLT